MKITHLIATFSTMAAMLLAAATAPASAAGQFELGGAGKGTASTVTYTFAGQPAVAVFVRGPGGLMYAKVSGDGGASWVEWTPIGDLVLKGDPSCVARSAGRIDCTAMGPNNNTYWTTFDAQKIAWTGWLNLGGAASSDPSIVATKEGGKTQLRIFVRGPANHLFMNTLSGGNWSDWKDLDGTIGSTFSCTAISTLGAHCFDSSNGNVQQVTDITHQTGNDVVVEDLGGAVSGTVSAVWAGNELTIFAKGPGDALWLKSWANGWSDWKQSETVISSAPGCAIASGEAWCATVNGNGTVSVVRFDI